MRRGGGRLRRVGEAGRDIFFALGTGRVDFMRFLPRLAEAGVLDYCIEVRPREKAKESLMNLRAMVLGKRGKGAGAPGEPGG